MSSHQVLHIPIGLSRYRVQLSMDSLYRIGYALASPTLGYKDRARLALPAHPLRKRAFGEASFTILNS